jgi:hypothetical protein
MEHIEDLWRLPDGASAELGPFLRRISSAIVDGPLPALAD